MHTHPYVNTYANPTPMNTSEGLSTGRYGDFRSHHWRFVVDGNVAYHLTHNASKSWKIQKKVWAPGFEPWWGASHWTVLPLDYKPNHTMTCIRDLRLWWTDNRMSTPKGLSPDFPSWMRISHILITHFTPNLFHTFLKNIVSVECCLSKM
jgi:hypothetical protein